MTKPLRDLWEAREAAYAAFRRWEEDRPPMSPEERAIAVRFALDATALWLSRLAAEERLPAVDEEKIRGIARMREGLRVLGNRG